MMKDERKTKRQLLEELVKLKNYVSHLETSLNLYKESEIMLSSEKVSIQQYLDATESITVVIMADYKVRFINKKGCNILGYPKKQVIGKDWFDNFVPPQVRDGVRSVFERMINGNLASMEKLENPVLTKNGEHKLITWHHTVLKNHDGNIMAVFFSGQDITELKKVEEELLLAQRFESTTILAEGFAHDINNSLTSVLGNITIARMDKSVGNDVLERLEEAEKASANAKELISQFLSFVKGMDYAEKTPSVSKLIKNTANLVLKGSNVSCNLDLAPDLFPVIFDPKQFIQVISSLIINARKGLPEGGTIEILAANITSADMPGTPLLGNNYVKLEMTCTPIKSQPDRLNEVFDPNSFKNAKQPTSDLSTVYSLVKMHGGYVQLESKHGLSMGLLIFFPAVEHDMSIGIKEPVMAQGKGSILIMDDDELLRNSTKVLLTHLGYSVSIARDGNEAVELYKKSMKSDSKYDIVILDLTVPGKPGGKITMQSLLEIDPDVNAILSSGYASDPTIVSYKEHGFRGFIKKPYRIDELHSLIHMVIKTQQE